VPNARQQALDGRCTHFVRSLRRSVGTMKDCEFSIISKSHNPLLVYFKMQVRLHPVRGKGRSRLNEFLRTEH
jgi:hypothetical protein